VTEDERWKPGVHDRVALARFFDALMAIPLTDWRAAAARCPASIAGGAGRALQQIFDDRDLAWVVWSAREDVETALYRFDRSEGLPHQRTALGREHVRLVTGRAALAVLMRPVLASFFGALYGDFERIIPAESLRPAAAGEGNIN
jgi:hypothetical protein